MRPLNQVSFRIVGVLILLIRYQAVVWTDSVFAIGSIAVLVQRIDFVVEIVVPCPNQLVDAVICKVSDSIDRRNHAGQATGRIVGPFICVYRGAGRRHERDLPAGPIPSYVWSDDTTSALGVLFTPS